MNIRLTDGGSGRQRYPDPRYGALLRSLTLPDIQFFDAFTRIGPRRQKHPAHPWTLDEVLEEMRHCSVSGALVASTTSISYELTYGNLELSDRLEAHDSLFAVWNVMPHHTGEFPPPDELNQAMATHNVRAVMLNPKTNAWDWCADHSQELLAWLAKTATLTIISRPEFGAYSELDQVLSRHPELPLLLTGVWWSEQRLLLPLLRRHANLHISFDRLQIHYGIEYLHEVGCADQLVFASDAPLMSMGAHRTFIDYADVPEEVKRKVAGGNLVRLLKGQAPPRDYVNPDEDELMAAARQGQPLPTPLLDMHMHILHAGMNGAGGGYRMHRGGPDGVFPLLARLGCRGGGFMSWNGTVSGDSLAGNDCVREALDAAPPGFWGLASFDPVHYSATDLERLIPEVYADQRFIGMKPYGVYGVPYDDPAYAVWWRYGNERQFYALLHRTRGDFREIDALAEAYPNVRWLVAHCGSDYRTADMAIESAQKHPNVYAEITLTPVTLGIIEYLVAGAGEDRVLYGSDLPMRDPRQQLGWVVFSRLPLAQKQKVLAGNAMAVVQPCLERLPAASRPPA